MLKVTVEIHPFGDSKKARVIDGLIIWNTGTGNYNRGNYEFVLGTTLPEIGTRKITSVKGHKRVEGSLKLLYLCLKEIYGKNLD